MIYVITVKITLDPEKNKTIEEVVDSLDEEFLEEGSEILNWKITNLTYHDDGLKTYTLEITQRFS